MRKRMKIIVSGLLLTVCIVASAQEIQLDLKKSIELATDSSLQAFRAKNMYRAGFWAYQTYKAERLPSLSLSMTPAQYNRDFVRRYDPDNNIDVYRQQQSLYSYANLSLSQNVDFTGGTFYIDTELGYFKNIGANAYSQFSSVPVRIGYSQSLFGFNGFKWQRKIEPLKFEKVKKEFLYSCEEISENVISYFFELAMAQTEYDMAVDNVSTSDSLFKIGEERFKIAAISQADLLTLKLDALNAKNSLKTIEVDLKRAMFNFVSFLNLPKETKIRLHLPEKPFSFEVSANNVLSYSKENNPNYLKIRQNILEAERDVDQTQKSTAFEARFSASAGFNQVASTISEAYKSPLQQDVVRVNMTIPLIDWGVRKGKYNMAKSNLNVTKISALQSENTLEQDVVLTVSDFGVQQNMIASAEEARNLASMAYESTKQRFVIGKADINSITLSLNRLSTAQKNYIIALKNYWLSYYKLRKLSLFDFEKNETLSFQFDSLMK